MDFVKNDNIIHLKATDKFDEVVLQSKTPMIVDFYADWCGPCRKLTPIIEERLAKHKNFKLVKVNVDECPELSEKYEVSGIPYVMLIQDGKKVGDFTGGDESALDKLIAQITSEEKKKD